MKVMFVCKHNRFRSKVAESIFSHYAKGRHQVISRGLIKDIGVHSNVKRALKSIGVKLKSDGSRNISVDDFKWADIEVIVADNVPKSLFLQYDTKIKVWKIRDTHQDDYNGILSRIKNIEKRVKSLIEKLDKLKN